MENEGAFRIVLAILFVAFIAHRGYYTRKQPTAESRTAAGRSGDWLATTASLLAFPGLIALLVYIAYPPWMAWAALPLPAWVRWAGGATGLVGFGLLQWAQQTLGTNWSDTPRWIPGQALVTEGPYRWIRHPIYSAFLLIMGSTLLLSANWLVGLTWIGMTVLETISRARFEEQLMLEQLGERYRSYMQRTGRFLPRIG